LSGLLKAELSGTTSGRTARTQEFLRLAGDMVDNRETPTGPSPPNLLPRQWSFLGPVVLDTVPHGAPGSHFTSTSRELGKRLDLLARQRAFLGLTVLVAVAHVAH